MSQQISEQLKESTKRNHQQLEKLLVTHLRSITTKEEYVKLLQLFYGYFGALEDKINQYIDQERLPDYRERRKTKSIFDDIKIMEGCIPEKAKGHDLPKIEDHLQAFGALYVIEGSTLGGKIISQMISKKLDTFNTTGVSFFNGYGDNTERMWTSFKEVLNSQFQNQEEADVIINTANNTFLKFKLWIEKNVL